MKCQRAARVREDGEVDIEKDSDALVAAAEDMPARAPDHAHVHVGATERAAF